MKLLLAASLIFSVPAFASIEESDKPERLRDRLINIENTVSDYKSLAAKSNDEFKSLSVRMKHFESLLHDLPSPTAAHKSVKQVERNTVQPYTYMAL